MSKQNHGWGPNENINLFKILKPLSGVDVKAILTVLWHLEDDFHLLVHKIEQTNPSRCLHIRDSISLTFMSKMT